MFQMFLNTNLLPAGVEIKQWEAKTSSDDHLVRYQTSSKDKYHPYFVVLEKESLVGTTRLSVCSEKYIRLAKKSL